MALLDATSIIENHWFRLDRHEKDATSTEADSDASTSTDTDPDDDDNEAEQLLTDAVDDGEADSAADTEDDDPEGAEHLGDKGKKALEAMKARLKAERDRGRREMAALRKQAAEQAAKIAEFEDRDRSELEKATAKAERLEKQAKAATARAVKSEIRALSADSFTDPTDAADVLMRDPSKYVDASGEIDEDAIRSDLDDLLERKPHWRKPEPVATETETRKPARQKPKPDPGQGGRGEKPVDYRTASREEVDAELARMGVRRRL